MLRDERTLNTTRQEIMGGTHQQRHCKLRGGYEFAEKRSC